MIKRICAALVAVFMIALSLTAQARAPRPAVVKSIGFVKSDTGLEISVLIAGVFVHESLVLSSPNRLVIDVSPTRRLEAHTSYDVQAFGVTTVRTGQFKRRVSRVILDFSGPIPAYAIEKTKAGLVVKIAAAPAAAEKAAEPAAPVEIVKEEKPAAEVQPAPKPEVQAKAAEAVAPAARPAEPAAKPAEPAFKPAEPTAVAAAPKAETAVPAPKPVEPKASEPKARPGFANTAIGLMAGSYRSDSSRFREVYGSQASAQFGLNLSRTLLSFKGFHLDISGEARLVSKTGKSTLTGGEAKIKMYPLSLAGLLMFDIKSFTPFVGYGGDWFNYKETSPLANSSGWASGDHFQGGLSFVIPGQHSLRLKIYYKFTRVKATERGIEVKLGGPEYGVGLSFGFGFLSRAGFFVR